MNMEQSDKVENKQSERSESSSLNLNSIAKESSAMDSVKNQQAQTNDNANSALPKVTIEGLDNTKKPADDSGKKGGQDGGLKDPIKAEGSGSASDNSGGKKVIKDGGPKDPVKGDSGSSDDGGKKGVKDGGPKDPVKDKFDDDKAGGKDKFSEKDKLGEKKDDKHGDKFDDKFGGKDKFDDKFGGKDKFDGKDKFGGKDDDIIAQKKEKAEAIQNNKNEKAKLGQKKTAQAGMDEMSDYDLLIKKKK